MSDSADMELAEPSPPNSNPSALKGKAREQRDEVTGEEAKNNGNGSTTVNGSATNGNEEEDRREASENDDDDEKNEEEEEPVENGVPTKGQTGSSNVVDENSGDSDVQMLQVSGPLTLPSTSEDAAATGTDEMGDDSGDSLEDGEDSDNGTEDDALEEIGDDDEEEVEEVNVSTSDSDIMEVEAEDPLCGSGSGGGSPAKDNSSPNSSNKVITIDDMDTLRSLANDAKKQQPQDCDVPSGVRVVDANSILSGKSGRGGVGGGVTITPTSSSTRPAKSNFPPGSGFPAGLTISQAGSHGKQQSSHNQLNDPNLTDDTYVVEAPSFIVPYVYEKPPKESIVEFKDSIEKMRREKENGDDGEGEGECEKNEEDEKDKEEEEVKTTQSEDQKKPKALFFETVLGKFIMDLGMNLVQEQVKIDLLKEQQRRSHKDKSAAVMHAIMSLKKNIETSKETNKDFAHELKKCRFCSFRTESQCVLDGHLETPHVTRANLLRCNFCKFEHKVTNEVLTHMFLEHGVRGKLERSPSLHQCPQCPYEENMKGKLTRHKVGCDKRFRNERNQEPPHDWEPPAKIPKPAAPRSKVGLHANAAAASFLGAGGGGGGGGGVAAKSAGGYSHVQQFQQQQHLRKQPFPNAAGNLPPGMPQLQFGPRGGGGGGGVRGGRNVGFAGKSLPQQHVFGQQQGIKQAVGLGRMRNQVVLQAMNQASRNPNIANLGSNSSVTIQSIGQRGNAKSNQPSISITPLPGRGGNGGRAAQGQSPLAMKPGQPGGVAKGGFVICEICDGYIRDLEQLRNHMQWIHKVKIHPKMIYNRPPLNCQKCQFRFFTDQGLERHLLGSHGLVTASMQDLANKSQDSGRCPVCGKVYQWKLLNHVAKDHMKVLKPAHLSYKCTVCTATFGQYKLFENHVYTAHSAGNRKGANRQQQQHSSAQGASKAAIKVSDEITIIPQKSGSKSSCPTPPTLTPDKAAPKSTSGPDVIELDDDEEEIDEEMKESNECSANDGVGAKGTSKPGDEKGQNAGDGGGGSSNGSTKRETTVKNAAAAAAADSGDEGVEEIHDEENDD